MEFIPTAEPRNVPRELQARLYREIGVAAVAEALGLPIEAALPDEAVSLSVAPATVALPQAVAA